MFEVYTSMPSTSYLMSPPDYSYGSSETFHIYILVQTHLCVMKKTPTFSQLNKVFTVL